MKTEFILYLELQTKIRSNCCIYPKKEPVDFEFKGNTLTVHFKKPVMARLFELRKGLVRY